MDNSLSYCDERKNRMGQDAGKYYTVAGMQFEKDRHYTVSDYLELIPAHSGVELINGIFYDLYPETAGSKGFPSLRHQRIVTELARRIGNHIAENQGEYEVYVSGTGVQLSEDDTFLIPDIFVVCDKTKLEYFGCKGAPDWVIEVVSPSNPGNDYLRKLNLYIPAGVREYWIIDPEKEKVTVYDPGLVPKVYSFEDKIPTGIYENYFVELSGL
ncbi:MAG: Uma2 family endonuclease [Lachnospiraceae bacterium]|nr:Uma2 family endonuclease [Lachnospiraceae bacterium]